MIKSIVDMARANLARQAGVWYLVIIVCGISSEVFLRGNLIVDGDASATAANLVSKSSLFLTAFVLDSIMVMADIALAVVLFVILSPVGRTLALAATVFRLIQASILGVNLLIFFAAGVILAAVDPISQVATTEQADLAMLFLSLHAYGYDLALIFFGVGNVLLALLLLRTQRVPVFIPYMLAAASLVYLVGSYVRFLAPASVDTFELFYIIPLFAETLFCLWLLFRGNKLRIIPDAN